MARPRNQARRREQLVSAASELVARRGLSGVRLRDVADAAGVTSGAVLYYYENLAELFTAAYVHAIERFCEHRERATATITDPWLRLLTAVRLGIPAGPDDEEVRLLYELEPVAFREPACAALMSAYIERQVAMYAAILEVGAATGTFTLAHDSRTLARNIVSMEDGQGLYVLTGRDSPTQVERRILAYVSAATGQARDPLRPASRTTSRHSDTGQAPEGQARSGRSADGPSAGSRAGAGPG